MGRFAFTCRVLLVAVVALMLFASGCDKGSSFYVGAKFYAVNNTDEGLHIYLNSIFQFSLEAGADDEVEDLDEGEYTASARRQSDGSVVKEEDIYLREDERFFWEVGQQIPGSKRVSPALGLCLPSAQRAGG